VNISLAQQRILSKKRRLSVSGVYQHFGLFK